MALASCACLKESMTKEILSSISSNVRYSCDSTATDDISSAVEVRCDGFDVPLVAANVTSGLQLLLQCGPGSSGSHRCHGLDITNLPDGRGAG